MENPLLELQEYDNLVQALKSGKGPLQVTGTLDSQKVHLMYELGEASAFSWKLVVTRLSMDRKEIIKIPERKSLKADPSTFSSVAPVSRLYPPS